MALFLFALAVLSAVALRGMIRRSIATVGVALLLVAVCTASTVVPVPMIRRSAVLTSAGQPYCLALPASHRPIDSNMDMTFLYARGSRLTPHMVLWVERAGGTSPYHWSYTCQKFVKGVPRGTVRNCQPRPDFLETLAPVTSGLHVGVGDDFYVIPSEYWPRHVEQDYFTMQFSGFTMQFSGADQRPLRAASIQAGQRPIEDWRDTNLRDNGPATKIPPSSRRSDGAFGYEIRTFDAQGRLVEKFRYIRQSVCRLEWVSGNFLSDVTVNLTTPDHAPGLKAKFETLWRSFRQDG